MLQLFIRATCRTQPTLECGGTTPLSLSATCRTNPMRGHVRALQSFQPKTMNLEETLNDIIARLRQGRFPNEQAISQGIVLRILERLGWPSWETDSVWPEYKTGEGRVDFALCHPPCKPIIFIEVKQPGKAEDAVRQALEYAFHTGVPFIVLTDGKTWSFYLPAEQGSYEDRRVYKLDLFERNEKEAEVILERYLLRSRVESGEALETARKEYRSRNRRSQARAGIPDAWNELVEKGDELLVDLLASAVETKAGVRPEDDDVIQFLASLYPSNEFIQAASDPAPGSRPREPRRLVPAPAETGRNGTLVIKGTSFPYGNAKDAMVTALRELGDGDPTFLQRCSIHPDARGRKRRYIARSVEELYLDRPDLQEYHEKLPGGWFVATNLNNVLKRTIIRLAAEVAGLSFGRDVVVTF